jgi:hypothetical protein
MQRYYGALDHLNRALAALIAEGELHLVAVVSYPIALLEEAILRQHDGDPHERRDS